MVAIKIKFFLTYPLFWKINTFFISFILRKIVLETLNPFLKNKLNEVLLKKNQFSK